MSEENEGEEGQNRDFSEEFKFYFSFTKPLVLELPTKEEKSLAAAWVQKLEEEPETTREKEQRLNYLKMLLFVLQRGRLSGIFAREPPSGPLQPFPQGLSVLDMGNIMLDQDDDFLYGGGDAGCIPYSKEISNDLREYVASQEVPNFGVQMYYAWSSDEPIHKWSLFDEEKFPQYIIEKIKQMKAGKLNEKSKRDGSETEKMVPNFSFCDILSKKKVKSPEEIEESQGRSFLTYMGLVGRMGNFNDKCDDDPEKFQRQNSPRKCPIKKKRCPGGADENNGEDFDNFMNGGGLNSINRPCLCAAPSHQPGCPIQGAKKRPQSSCFEGQAACPRGNSDNENGQWCNAAKSEGRGRSREQHCFDNSSPGLMPPPQRNNTPRNNSNVRRALFHTPNQEGNSGGCSSQNDPCACSSPPCTCPCPRVPSKTPCSKTPGPAGRVCQSPSRTFPRSPRQETGGECNLNRSRGVAHNVTPFNAPEPCTPSSGRPDMSPAGGRTYAAGPGGGRPVIHCYDNQNPDPNLTKVTEKVGNWMPLQGGGYKYIDSDYKNALLRDQLIMDGMKNKSTLNSRRGLFDNSQQPGPSGANRTRPQSECSPSSNHSSPLGTNPICEYSSPGSNEPEFMTMGYGDSESDVPDNAGYNDACGGMLTYKKPQPQGMSRVQNAGPFAVGNNQGRLANMSSILKGIKQKTEAHREKCEDTGRPRTPTANAPCYAAGSQNQSQTKSCPKQLPRSREGCPNRSDQGNRSGMGGSCGVHPQQSQAPCPLARGQPNSFQNKNLTPSIYPGEAYDFTLYKMLPQPQPCQQQGDSDQYPDEDEGDADATSSGSLEEPCQNRQEDRTYHISDQCQAALNRRPQDYYKIAYMDESDFPTQESNQDVCLKDNNNQQYSAPNNSPVQCGRPRTGNDYYETEWMSPKRSPVQASTLRTFPDSLEEPRPIVSARTSPGRAVQMASYMDDSQIDEACNRAAPSQPYRNRYMEQSLEAAATGGIYQPACSTPLRPHKETFKDRKMDDLSNIQDNVNHYVMPNNSPVQHGRPKAVNEYYETEWTSPKKSPAQASTMRTPPDSLEEPRAAPARTSPGRAVQMASYMNDSQIDEACNRAPASQPYRNRYMEQSLVAASTGGGAPQPICSTPVRPCKENFKDRKFDDLSSIH